MSPDVLDDFDIFFGYPTIFELLLQKERDEACERAILARDNLQNGEVWKFGSADISPEN